MAKAPLFLKKCNFIGPLDYKAYLKVIAKSQIVIDPLYRGCGTTAIDILGQGIPIITMPDKHSRSRFVSALYEIMGIENAPIARTHEEYITMSLELSKTSERYDNLKAELLEKFDKLRDKQHSINKQLIDFFRQVSSLQDLNKQ